MTWKQINDLIRKIESIENEAIRILERGNLIWMIDRMDYK